MHKPYDQDFFVAKPTKRVLMMRTNFIWQLVRFIYINLKMTSMIIKSHNDKIPAPQDLKK